MLVESVLRRTAYLVLLYENPRALEQLVKLCSVSPWIAEQLAGTPLLLDELLNTHKLYTPPAKDSLRDDLGQQLLRVPEGGRRGVNECLAAVQKAHVLRVAASGWLEPSIDESERLPDLDSGGHAGKGGAHCLENAC